MWFHDHHLVAVLSVTGSLPLPCNQGEDRAHHPTEVPSIQLPRELDPLHGWVRKPRGSGCHGPIENASRKVCLVPSLPRALSTCQDGVLRPTRECYSLLSGPLQFAHSSNPLGSKLQASEESLSREEIPCGEQPESPDPRELPGDFPSEDATVY